MKIVIMETITTPGGHEVDFDRIVFKELKTLGHEVTFYVPEEFRLQVDYGTTIHELESKGGHLCWCNRH